MHSCRLKVQHISNWAISAYNFRTMKDKPHCTTQLFVIEKPLLNTSWSMVQIWISKTMTGHPRVNFVRKIGRGCDHPMKWSSDGCFCCPALPLPLITSIRDFQCGFVHAIYYQSWSCFVLKMCWYMSYYKLFKSVKIILWL